MAKVEYVRCPRCELNYMEKGQEYCKVCEAELASKGNQEISDEEAREMNLCPICKHNYLMDDEEICSECAQEKSVLEDNDDMGLTTDDQIDDKEERTENWRQYVENDDAELPEEEFDDMTSITTIDDEEDLDEEEEFDDEEAEDLDEEFEDDFEDLDDEALDDLDDDLDDDLEDDLDDDNFDEDDEE